MSSATHDLAYAMQSWNALPKVIRKDSGGLETADSPMHPTLYLQLAQIKSFTEANGANYDEYIKRWKHRYASKFETEGSAKGSSSTCNVSVPKAQ